ncbi:MAG: TIGR04076 family protein [Candidatus Bathyarchaeota archaeon]|nr:MAG: TIGR04076 family protein [Candidatus Bathyarchaeota archaeon]
MIKVKVVGGECQGGHHRVGDHWEIESLTPEGMCLGAWGAVFPFVMA